MQLRRFLDGREIEVVDGIDALVLLAANENGKRFHVFAGSEEKVKALFIWGCTHWPQYIPFDPPVIATVESALKHHPLVIEGRPWRMSPEFLDRSVFIGQGDEILVLSGLTDHLPPELSISGISTSLIFLEQAGRMLNAHNGRGSQKNLLWLYAVGVLWGVEVQSGVEELVYGGPHKDIILKIMHGMRNSVPGEITQVDLSEDGDN